MLWDSKETSHWDGSFGHLKHTKKLMGKEINAILGAQTILIWTYDSPVSTLFANVPVTSIQERKLYE